MEIFSYRFLLAYLVIIFFAPRRLWADSFRDELLFVVLGFTGGSFYFVTENTALEFTAAGNVSLLVCTAPVWTALLGFRGRMGWAFWIGTAVALLGVGLMVFNGSFVLRLSPWGDVLSIAAAVSWAVYSLVMRRLTERYGIMFITRKVFFWGLATIVPFLAFRTRSWDFGVLAEPMVWGNLLFLGLVASLVCFAVWNRVIREVGVVRSSSYIYLNPVFTMVAAWLVLGEAVTWVALAGLVLIVGGLYLAERRVYD